MCGRWKHLSYRESSAHKMLFHSSCFWAYLSTKILRRMSLNDSKHGYSRIKESMLEFVWNSHQEQFCGARKCPVLYTTASSISHRAKASETVVMWAHCSLCSSTPAPAGECQVQQRCQSESESLFLREPVWSLGPEEL